MIDLSQVWKEYQRLGLITEEREAAVRAALAKHKLSGLMGAYVSPIWKSRAIDFVWWNDLTPEQRRLLYDQHSAIWLVFMPRRNAMAYDDIAWYMTPFATLNEPMDVRLPVKDYYAEEALSYMAAYKVAIVIAFKVLAEDNDPNYLVLYEDEKRENILW